jgi:hypothetical protein
MEPENSRIRNRSANNETATVGKLTLYYKVLADQQIIIELVKKFLAFEEILGGLSACVQVSADSTL